MFDRVPTGQFTELGQGVFIVLPPGNAAPPMRGDPTHLHRQRTGDMRAQAGQQMARLLLVAVLDHQMANTAISGDRRQLKKLIESVPLGVIRQTPERFGHDVNGNNPVAVALQVAGKPAIANPDVQDGLERHLVEVHLVPLADPLRTRERQEPVVAGPVGFRPERRLFFASCCHLGAS